MKKILGISAFYHDSAAALIIGGKIIAAAQEERFIREKHTADFPVNAINYCLEEAGLEIDELDAIVFYDKPFLKFERILETYYAFAPKGIFSFLKAMPVWINEKLLLKKLILKSLKKVGAFNKTNIKLLFSEHHLSHAASAFYCSPFQESAILTIDGVGEWSTATISLGKNNNITILKELNFPHSVGLLYSAFTYFLGFTVNSGEYKLMGLAPYGNEFDEQTRKFEIDIKKNIVDVKDDGSIWLNQSYFNYATGLRMVNENKWEELFGFQKRLPEMEIKQHHCNLAFAIQNITEEIVLKMAKETKKITGSENLCLAGGVALNCVANSKLLKANIFKNIFIQPAAGDAGGSLGSALAVNYLYFKENREVYNSDLMLGSYLGPSYSEKEIEQTCKKLKAVYKKYINFNELVNDVATKITEGNVVGWFQGRMEFGPRALGNRSILGDPTNPEIQKKLNLKIKYREDFRPFAPSILFEDLPLYYDFNIASPYMLFVASLKKELRNKLPENYYTLSLSDKLNCYRSNIPAVTHLDFTSRIQTVHKETNLNFWKLINAFKLKSGFGLIVNTSFNVRGEPIVCSPHDAYLCFMNTEMDYLVIDNFFFTKSEQPFWKNETKWKMKFETD